MPPYRRPLSPNSLTRVRPLSSEPKRTTSWDPGRDGRGQAGPGDPPWQRRRTHRSRRTPAALGPRPAARSEAAAEAPRGLGHPHPAADRRASPRLGAVQPRHRQQAAGLRPGRAPGRRRAVRRARWPRATVLQRKTGRPVQFELTEQTRDAVARWIGQGGRKPGATSSRAGSAAAAGRSPPATTRA